MGSCGGSAGASGHRAGDSTCTTRSPSRYSDWHSRPGSAESVMENRKQAILRAVVNEFTTSAVPVGSQALQSRYFVNLSSATIRSELAELAEAGYLAQPHTSAGRIPTDSGYRYFVDFLMDLEAVPEQVATYITDELRVAPSDVQGLVE